MEFLLYITTIGIKKVLTHSSKNGIIDIYNHDLINQKDDINETQ